MSKIALPIAELKPALIGFGKVISKRCTLPVLNHLKIERTKDGWITITGTDLDAYVTYRLEQPSEGEALTLLVPCDELQKLAKNCPKNDTLLLAGDSKAVTIQYAIGSQVAEAKVDSLAVEEFPEIPRIKGEPIPLNDTLRQSIHEAMDCASEDQTRLILNSAYIDVSKEEGHYVVGTNGSHLFASNSFKLPLKDSVIIPTHKFLGYREFNNDGEWQLRIGTPQHKDDAPQIQISSRRWRFIAKQYEGSYPNWRQVVPSEFASGIQFEESSLDALADTIERLPDHDERFHAIGIERKERAVNLLWKSNKEEPWKRLPVTAEKLTGNDITIYLNRHYLTKALRFSLHQLDLIDSLSPMRFSQNGRQMIVMPVNTEGPPMRCTPAATPSEQPAAHAPAAKEERKPMPRTSTAAPTTNGNGHNQQQPAPETKPALEIALDQIETIKGSYREAIKGLNELGDTLKQVQREHRTIQSFRANLEKLTTGRA